jgi:hypothetical protein
MVDSAYIHVWFFLLPLLHYLSMQIMIVRTYSAYSKGPIKDMYFPRQNAPTHWVCVEA